MQSLSDYTYDLPRDLIAQSPLDRRDESRLLILGRDGRSLHHSRFRSLGEHLRDGDLLVLNDTKVVPARIPCRRETGGRVDGILLGTADGDGTLEAMFKSRARLQEGERLLPLRGEGSIVLEERRERGRWRVRLADVALEGLFHESGRAPLPPYIERDSVEDARDGADLEQYQTIYARVPGAVAAPTAGLHFSDEVFADLKSRGVCTARVTLHVGPGTFLPVRTENIAEHRMLPERFRIEADQATKIRAVRQRGGRIIAVGTTTCRALETAQIGQREPDDADRAYEGVTDLFIHPGYRFTEIDALLTNFHMPESTLLMLVAAFVGRERILDAYRVAVAEGYRFFSYGDAMLAFAAGPARAGCGGAS